MVHISDRIYALQQAIKHAMAAGEQSNVIADLRAMLAEAQQEARNG